MQNKILLVEDDISRVAYVHQKLSSVISNETSEKLLVCTDDKYLISILVEINDRIVGVD